MNNIRAIKLLRFLFITAALSACSNPSSIAKHKEPIAEQFIRLLNEFDRDSLDLVTTTGFTLNEVSGEHVWTKRGFLDTFFRQSKAVNGTFRILETQSISAYATTYLVEDLNDYHQYLKPGNPVKWLLTVHSNENQVTSLVADSTSGNKEYFEDFAKRTAAFSAWLKEKYDETPEQLLKEDKMVTRLKEYATKKE